MAVDQEDQIWLLSFYEFFLDRSEGAFEEWEMNESVCFDKRLFGFEEEFKRISLSDKILQIISQSCYPQY